MRKEIASHFLAFSLSLSFHPACDFREDRWAMFKNRQSLTLFPQKNIYGGIKCSWLEVFVVNFCFFIFPANIFRANGNFFGACWLDAIEGVKGGRFFLSFGIRHRSTMFLFRSWICKRVKWIWECIGFFTCATNRSFDWPFVFMVFLQLVSLRYVTSWEGSENIRISTSQSFENRD